MDIVGTLAAIASLTIIVFGLPGQIWQNYKRKSVEGIDAKLIYSVSVAYTLWSIYGWTKPNLFLAISQTPGCVLAFILFFQLYHYRRGKKCTK